LKQLIIGFVKKYKAIIFKISGIILIVLFYRCPAKKIFGIDCPGCGLTRACLSALRLDFRTAFEYHPLFWLFGAGLVYFIFYEQIKKRLKISGKTEIAILIISSVLFMVVWLIRTVILGIEIE